MEGIGRERKQEEGGGGSGRKPVALAFGLKPSPGFLLARHLTKQLEVNPFLPRPPSSTVFFSFLDRPTSPKLSRIPILSRTKEGQRIHWPRDTPRFNSDSMAPLCDRTCHNEMRTDRENMIPRSMG